MIGCFQGIDLHWKEWNVSSLLQKPHMHGQPGLFLNFQLKQYIYETHSLILGPHKP